MGYAIKYFLSSMSRPYSRYRVAVTVDQRIMRELAIPPIKECMSVKMAIKANRAKGSREYPRILIIL
jgi:hypothetical protein